MTACPRCGSHGFGCHECTPDIPLTMQHVQEAVTITGRDLRVGMGIGGWAMEWTALHHPSGCKIVWQTHGAYPASQHGMKERALMALELLTEVYQ